MHASVMDKPLFYRSQFKLPNVMRSLILMNISPASNSLGIIAPRKDETVVPTVSS